MLQIAIFVDAGYLFAQGSALIKGAKQPRSLIELSVPNALDKLGLEARKVAPTARLLRIYWYDGILRGGRLTTEQSELANSANTKLRLGMVNGKGEQKGVDSLIVTDLIDLARNQAISDALILSGDEDIRVGVQIAQTFGVRIHILGIKPARGSQSPDLLQEADTRDEWDVEVVSKFMNVKSVATRDSIPVEAALLTTWASTEEDAEFKDVVVDVCKAALRGLDNETIMRALKYLEENRDAIPSELDRPTLATLRTKLGRDLTDAERREYRKAFAATLKARRSR